MSEYLNYTVEYKNRKEWYKNGKLHRIHGPAIEYKNGFKIWYKNGLSYKECGPEIIYNVYIKKWFINKKALEYKLSTTPKNCKCSYCLDNILNVCSFKTNDNFFHEKCLCLLLCSK